MKISILPRLHEIQHHHDYLPEDELRSLAVELNVPLYRIQELISFFPHFRPEWQKPPQVEVQICRDMSCHLKGSSDWIHSKEKGLAGLAKAGELEIKGVSCLGRCDRAVACVVTRHDLSPTIHEELFAGLSLPEFREKLTQVIQGKNPAPTPDGPSKPGEPFRVDSSAWMIDLYAQGNLPPYTVARKFVEKFPRPIPPPTAGLSSKETTAYIEKEHPWLKVLEKSGLMGMGGAGVPAAKKWTDVWLESRAEKYIVANGDESEPATFKDRELILQKAHLLVEGMLLAGLMTNATAGIIFIRHEYPEQIQAARSAIEQARQVGICGKSILGTERDYDLEVFVSPGGYICGEQSALIEAIENKRAQPRNRPPELGTNGLWNCPTVVNNIETLSWTPAILHNGADWYINQNRAPYKGRRFFSISGDVHKPGVFEVPIGLTLGELIDLAGGVHGGELGAVATSGPSGGFLPASFRIAPTEVQPNPEGVSLGSLPLDLTVFRNKGRELKIGYDLMLGAGLVVYNNTRDMLQAARNAAQFFRNESCGKCVPCRIGSQKMVELGTGLLAEREDRKPQDMPDEDCTAPASSPGDIARTVKDMKRALELTSICGLGTSVSNPLASYLQFFAPKPESERKSR